MCLAVPARVVELLPPQDAWVELDGVRQRVSLALLDAVQVGEYVIVHVGFALQVIDEAEALATLALISELQREPQLPPSP
jgi:hydrogenase expression/formation protein HypC